jgi:hypothetical protein
MASTYASPSVQARIVNGQSRAVLAGVVGILLFLAIALVTAHALARLDAMSNTLTQVSANLQTLQGMNRKLDTLSEMSVTLRKMNGKLLATNQALTVANAQLSSMRRDSGKAGVSLDRMNNVLNAMRADIHVMSHKITGSFLFRSVK